LTVRIKKYNDLHLRIETDSIEYLDAMRLEFTRTVPDFRFTPAYKKGRWSGRVCMIEKYRHTFPYGLLFDYVRIHKKNFSNIPIEIDKEVKEIFQGPDIEIKYDLPTHEVRPYQDDCVRACIKHTKGIIRSATASGKSLVIAYIIRNLLQNGIIQKSIIIVPNTGLITQFYQDLLDYGFDHTKVGVAYAARKQWEKETVISTWQTLSNNHDKLDLFQCVFCDETHQAKAHELKKILENAKTSQYRFGFTGTLHSTELDNWNTKAYLGPIIREYPAGFLAEQGFISKCNIHMLNIEYNEENKVSYHDMRDMVFRNDYRVRLVKKLTDYLDHNVLLLVDKVEKEGEFLKDVLSNSIDKEVIFLSGKDDVSVREKWRKECMKRDNIALIATYGIFQMGINIPNLKYIILVSPFKAKIRVLQSIGRALRMYVNKENGAHIFDIHDHTKFFDKYGTIRLRYYDLEKFDVTEHVFYEGDSISLAFLSELL